MACKATGINRQVIELDYSGSHVPPGSSQVKAASDRHKKMVLGSIEAGSKKIYARRDMRNACQYVTRHGNDSAARREAWSGHEGIHVCTRAQNRRRCFLAVDSGEFRFDSNLRTNVCRDAREPAVHVGVRIEVGEIVAAE